MSEYTLTTGETDTNERKSGRSERFITGSPQSLARGHETLLNRPTQYIYKEDENMKYLETGQKYAEQIKKEFCEELIVYEGDPDEGLDLRASHAYHEAVDVCARWLRELLLGELEMHPEYSSVRCNFRIPCGDLEVSIGVDSSEKCASDTQIPSWTETPIGVMDEFVFRALKNCENPVAELYKHMGVLASHIRTLLGLRGSNSPFITQELLAENGINDPICIHQMESILCNIGDFFEVQV